MTDRRARPGRAPCRSRAHRVPVVVPSVVPVTGRCSSTAPTAPRPAACTRRCSPPRCPGRGRCCPGRGRCSSGSTDPSAGARPRPRPRHPAARRRCGRPAGRGRARHRLRRRRPRRRRPRAGRCPWRRSSARTPRRRWTAAFVGFAPGLRLPRAGRTGRGTSRAGRRRAPRCPRGRSRSPARTPRCTRASRPGGWQLLGRTDAVLWDLDRDAPALLVTGTGAASVRFRPVAVAGARAPAAGSRPAPERRPRRRATSRPRRLEVWRPGRSSLVEDLGRPGHLDLGVGASGAAGPRRRRAREPARRQPPRRGRRRDRARRARAARPRHAGARGHRRPGRADPPGAGTTSTSPTRPSVPPFALRDGERLVLGPPATGLRAYVAVRGGLDVEPVLGSRSTDVLAGLGPAPAARRGRARRRCRRPPTPSPAGRARRPTPAGPPADGRSPSACCLGPRDDLAHRRGAVDRLCAATWTVESGLQPGRPAARPGRPLVRLRRRAAERGRRRRRRPGAAVRAAGRLRSPTTRSPGGTRWSASCTRRTWTASPSCARATRCGSSSRIRPALSTLAARRRHPAPGRRERSWRPSTGPRRRRRTTTGGTPDEGPDARPVGQRLLRRPRRARPARPPRAGAVGRPARGDRLPPRAGRPFDRSGRTAERAAEAATRVLALAGREDVPVHVGAELALEDAGRRARRRGSTRSSPRPCATTSTPRSTSCSAPG